MPSRSANIANAVRRIAAAHRNLQPFPRAHCSEVGESVELVCAVPEFVNPAPQLLQDRNVQVRQWLLRVPDVAATGHAGCLSTHHGDRQVVMEMSVAVADGG